MKSSPHGPTEHFRSLALVYQLVSEFVVPILIGILVDWQYRTTPWGIVVVTLVALLIGGWRVARIARQMGEQDRPPGGRGSP
jgi:F0F1-type ATP synthase assembly protein I